jgi:hypothetical protein
MCKEFAMKRLFWILLVLSSFSVSLFAQSDYKQIDWERFSSNIEIALSSGNAGLKQSAMQMIVRYNDHLNVDKAAEKVVKEFTGNRSQEMRKLALITLYKIRDDWAVEILKKHRAHERNTQIKETIESIVSAYENKDVQEADKIVNDVYLSLAFDHF